MPNKMTADPEEYPQGSSSAPPAHRVIGQKELLQRIPVSRTTLWRMQRTAGFPKAIQLSTNRIGWVEDEINAWLASRPRGMGEGYER